MRRTLFEESHDLFRDSFRSFIAKEIAPFCDGWERSGAVARDLYLRAGAAGFLGMSVPTEYGGGGVEDFRYNVVTIEEFGRAGVLSSGSGISLHNDLCLPYFLAGTTEEQKQRWLPGICSGELLTAVAMTEPGAGSDLARMRTAAHREGEHYVLNGAKTFISSGILSDLVIVACKTDPEAQHTGISLLVVEAGMAGCSRGRNLEKIGWHAQDTAELFFDNVHVPLANRIGEEGSGFRQLMARLPQERLHISVSAVAQAKYALASTLGYVKERRAFGQPIGSFQYNRFSLADLHTELDIAQVYVDRQVAAHNAGELTPEEAAQGKMWCTELLWRVLDTCLQLHGGYGYMEEYPIARAWRDGRALRIMGGTNEIMREIIGRSLGL
jgi:alkylation response protein AidB-like acyl-CoA dehydrogenase